MRTMKRAAAVALSVVMLMTSGVTAKAAVTDAQPAKSSSEQNLSGQTRLESQESIMLMQEWALEKPMPI